MNIKHTFEFIADSISGDQEFSSRSNLKSCKDKNKKRRRVKVGPITMRWSKIDTIPNKTKLQWLLDQREDRGSIRFAPQA